MAYNSAVQESIGFTPSMLMLGRELNLPIDIALGRPVNTQTNTKSEYAEMLIQKLEAVHNLARKHISIASDSQKRNYDKRLRYLPYNEGDRVWLYNPQVKAGLSAKLSKRWTGPFILKKINDVVYRIQSDVLIRKWCITTDLIDTTGRLTTNVFYWEFTSALSDTMYT